MQDGDTIQIAHVVRDMETAMHRYHDQLGMGPWAVYELKPPLLYDSLVRGEPSDHTYLIALAQHGNMQYELIQPLTGRSLYDEFLEERGEGLHHVKFYYRDCAAALRHYAGKGYSVVQSGRIDEDEFHYLDTEKDLGIIVEIGNAGTIRPPERWVPS